MHTIALHRWLITGTDGRRRPSRHLMSEADALATDPSAEKIDGTAETRQAQPLGEYPGHHQIAPKAGKHRSGAAAAIRDRHSSD